MLGLGFERLVVSEERLVESILRLVCLLVVGQELWRDVQDSGDAGQFFHGGVGIVVVLQLPQIALAHASCGGQCVETQLLLTAQPANFVTQWGCHGFSCVLSAPREQGDG